MSWSDATLESAPLEIIDGDRGKNYPKQFDFFDEGHCLFLSTTNVTTDGFRFDDCQFITESKDVELRKGKLQRNDIVLTTRGTLGNCAYYADSVGFDHIRINSGMVIVRVDEKELYAPFVYSFFRSEVFHKQVEGLRSGAAQPQLPIRDLKRVKLKYPSLDEQKRIAFVIANYDNLIENNKRRIALLEESARLLYREWFVHFRFPGHEHVKIIDGLPEGWKKGCVGDFYKTASGGTPSRKKPDFYTGDINWVKTQELQDGFIFSTQEKITEEAVQNSSAKVFPVNTVLVAMYGATIGQTGILATSAATNQACCAILMKDDHASYEYAYLYFREMKKQLINFSKGAAQNNVSQDIIKNLDMVLPSQLITKSFKAYTRPLLAQIKTLQLQNQKLTQARDILLPRLMNGDLAV